MAGCPRPFEASALLPANLPAPTATFDVAETGVYTIDVVFQQAMNETALPILANFRWKDGTGTEVSPVDSVEWINDTQLQIIATTGEFDSRTGTLYYTSDGGLMTATGQGYQTFDIEVPEAF